MALADEYMCAWRAGVRVTVEVSASRVGGVWRASHTPHRQRTAAWVHVRSRIMMGTEAMLPANLNSVSLAA